MKSREFWFNFAMKTEARAMVNLKKMLSKNKATLSFIMNKRTWRLIKRHGANKGAWRSATLVCFGFNTGLT